MERRTDFLVAIGAGVLALLGATSCSGKDPYSPGTKLGVFHVKAALTQTTCGNAPNPWEFDVRLNHEGTTLYWIQGGAPIQGIVDATAQTTLRAETTVDLRAADAKKKIAACAVIRKDTVAVSLADAEAKPTRDPSTTQSFSGPLAYTFAPTEGSDCADQITTAGGGFDALPCEVRYDLSGTFKSPPP